MSAILQITRADRETGLPNWRGAEARSVGGDGAVQDGGLSGLFSRVAAERADAVAVADGQETLSYRELEARSTAIASRLVLDFGVRRGELVGVVMERGVGAVAVILGVLKAGAAYVPMEATAPVERTRGILEEAGVRVVVAESPMKDALVGPGWTVMSPDIAGDALAGVTLPVVGAEDLAYVIYTSGSTGKPKGVPVRHGQVARVIEEGRSIYGLSTADVWTLFHSFAFDFSVWEMWGALLTGGRLAVVPRLVAREPLEFHAFLAREQVTVLNQTPSAFRMLMEVENEAGLAGPALRLVILAGEALDFGCLRPWFAKHGDERPRLYNMYGLTETTIFTTWRAVTAADLGSPSLIGKPLSYFRARVAGPDGEPVKAGETGELWVAGEAVFDGYWRRPELAAGAFAYGGDGRNYYRTGDMVRLLGDGGLEFIGRRDAQVQIRGYRVEPAEIEIALARHAGVKQAVVLAMPEHGMENTWLAACLVAHGAEPAAAELRGHLARLLPDYMIPREFFWMEGFSMTPNGKTDTKTLAEWVAQRVETPASVVDEDGGVTGTVRRLLARVTGFPVEKLPDDVSFLELGWDSMRMTMAGAHLRRAFGLAVTFRDLAGPLNTVGKLAQAITGIDAGAPGAPDPAGVAADEAVEYPLTHGQEEIYLLTRLGGEAALAFNEGMWIGFTGTLDAVVLARALDFLSMRHTVLRTTFAADGSSQTVHPEPLLKLETGECTGADDAAIVDHLRAWMAQPIDLVTGPPGRWILLRAGGGRCVFSMVLHHAIFDGWSCGGFCRELRQVYKAMERGEEPVLPPAVPYARYAAWEKSEELSALRDPAFREFWAERLENPPEPLRLPVRQGDDMANGFATETLRVAIPEGIVAAVRAAAMAAKHTVFTHYFGAFLALLHRLGGQKELLTGIPQAGQAVMGEGTLLGHCVRFLPIRSRPREDWTAGQFLDWLNGEMAGVMEHGQCTLGALARHFPLPRDADNAGLLGATFSLVPRLPVVDLADGRAGQTRILPKTHGGYPLAMWIYKEAAGMTVECVYHCGKFEKTTMEWWMEAYLGLLGAMAAAAADVPMARLPLVGQAGRGKLEAWSGAVCGPVRDATVHGLFAEAVARNPGAVAVAWDGGSMDYAALDGRSNAVAAALLARGTRGGDVVGIRMGRHADRIAAMLGVLKCGAAYMPVETDWPEQRQRQLCDKAGVKTLIVEKLGGQPVSDAASVLCMDELPGTAPAVSTEQPASADAPAYVMFTSGTTGEPKGIVVPHRGIVRLVLGADYVALGRETVMLHAAPAGFDASIFEIWGALAVGGKLVLAPENASLSEIADVMRRHRVTTLWLTAGLFQVMVDEHLEELGGVRELLAGGDVLSAAHARKLLARHPGIRLVNGYGPTENTTFTTCHVVAGDDLHGSALPIGRPLRHTTVFILDDNGELVPAGVPGELWTGGDGLALGYLGEPALTAEKFRVMDVGGCRTRLYRTGDLCQWRGDGVVEFHGRLDGQIKIRGFRIETAEIETALLEIPGVAAAKAGARGGSAEEKRLVAWVVADDRVDVTGLAGILADRLPSYLVPEAVVRVSHLPVNANGKVDMARLPEPDWGAAAMPTGRTMDDWSTWERRLAGIWSEMIGHPVTDAKADFFAHGGHSLLGLRMFSRLHKEFGVSLPLSALLRHPTLEGLAAEVGKLAGGRANGKADAGAWVTLRDGSGLTPLVCIHGGDGGVLFYRDLLPHLEPERPVHAIESAMLGRHEGVEEMDIRQTAADYIRTLKAALPTGPYALAGFSFGGVVAWEMAARLAAGGDTVEFLGLFDTHNPEVPLKQRSLAGRLRAYWAQGSNLGWGEQWTRLVARMADGMATHDRVKRELKEAAGMPGTAPHSELRRVQVREAHYRAMLAYEPADYAGRVVLFKAIEESDKYDLPRDYHWSRRAPALEIHPVPGRHLTLFDKNNVGELARILRCCLCSTRPLPIDY